MQAGHSFLWVFIGILFLIYVLPQKINVGASVTHVQSIPLKTHLRVGLIRVVIRDTKLKKRGSL